MTRTADNPTPPDTQTREQLATQLDRRFRLPLLAYFGRRVSNAAEAQDLTQDVFEHVLKALETQPIRNAEALIFTIAANLLRDRGRRTRTRGIEEPIPAEQVTDFADALTEDFTPERVVIAKATLEDVLTALDELGERTRTMFYLYRFEQLKIREIADMYGISASAVEKHVAKALLHLTTRLQRT